jgi:hypothetical protein
VAHNDIDASKFAFNYNYSFNYKLSTGNDSIVVNSYSDAVYTLSSAVTITVNSDQTQLIRNDSATRIPSARISFLRYMDNVYGNMSIGGKEYTSRYRDLTESVVKGNFLLHLIYYFCQLLMIIIAATILIKHVFDVMNKNKEVMTLFAMIEKDQIEKLKVECNNFIKNNLTELYDYESQEAEKEKQRKEEKKNNKEKIEKAESLEDSEDSSDGEVQKDDEDNRNTKSQALSQQEERLKQEKEQWKVGISLILDARS